MSFSTIKISQLSIAPPLIASDIMPVDHGGQTVAGSASQIYGANRRDGIQAAVPADGSASVTITFPTAFPNAVIKLDAPAFVGYTGSDVPVFAYKITAVTTAGYTILVTGGQADTTVNVQWGATGS